MRTFALVLPASLVAIAASAAAAQIPVPVRPAKSALEGASIRSDSATGQTVPVRNRPRTEFVADGAIANSLNTGEGGAPATGALGIRHYTERDVFAALITVAGTADTLVGDSPATFARALLNPGTSGQGSAASGLLDYQRFWHYGGNSQRIGAHVYTSFSRSTWRFQGADTVRSSDLTVLAGGLRASWLAIGRDEDSDGNSFSVTLEAGYTVRGIDGDAARDSEFKRRSLGTSRSVFHGPEFAFAIQLRQITASATVPILGAFGGPRVPGLTGVQPVVGFSINAPIFTF